MSHTRNSEFLENQYEDFQEFISKKDWVNAQIIIDNLYETGFEQYAVLLRKSLLLNQFQSSLSRTLHVPTECSFSSRDCHEEDCSCNQFSRAKEVPLKRLGLFHVAKVMNTIISKEPKEMIWHRGKILITSLPSRALAF